MATNYQGFQFNSQSPSPQPGAFQSQQFFPQPQGNIYLINNSLEMANVPTGVGVSVALCLNEGVMYLKTMQNGQPMFVGYRISPFEKEQEDTNSKKNSSENIPKIDEFDKIYNKKDGRLTVKDFIKKFPIGTYLITMRGHITCCIDGYIYDTFFPGDRLVWDAYEVKRKD